MSRTAPAKATTCARCGAALEAASSAELRCMVCLLQLAFEKSQTRSPARDSFVEQFGHYVIEKREDGGAWELGRGAMGVTYRATDKILERAVALKIIGFQRTANPAAAGERFLREARVAAALRHPNIATVYQFGIHEESGQCFYAMELIEGETLEERVRRKGPCDVPTTIEIARQVAAALLAAEARGLVHRDIKPANLMLIEGSNGSDFTIKVIDFGVAKALAATPGARELTHGGFIGTPAFASPEQFTDAPVDMRSDIYSLGATLWYLLTAHMPFGDRAGAGPPPIMQLKTARVPARLSSLLVSMLAFEPAARPGVGELAARLEILGVQGGTRKKWPLWLGLAAAFLAAGTAASLFWWPRPPNETKTPSKSIAVLPFENLSGNKDDTFLLHGIQDDLLVSLAKIGDLKVISRNSVVRYQDTVRDLPAIGKALGVKTVLEGSFRRRGDLVDINVQLIDPGKGEQIWAENYERKTPDLFALQRDLAARIAFALQAKLTSHETMRLQRRPTANGDAYLLYLQGTDIFHAYGREKGDLKRAEELLEKAVALDPTFALALAQLSQIETELHASHDPDPARRARAKAAADEALRLQPDLPEAHLALGRYYWIDENSSGEADYGNAMRELAIAQRGLPNDPEVYSNIGRVERHLGKWTESTKHLAKAVALDPNNEERWHRLFFNYELTRNYPAAWQALDRVIALSPDSWTYQAHRAYLQLIWKGDTSALEEMLTRPPSGDGPQGFVTEWRFHIALLLGKYREAEQMLRQDPRENFTQGWLEPIPKSFMFGQLYYRTGERAKAREYFENARPGIERTVQQRPLEGAWHLVLAEVYAGLGRNEDAIREGERATAITPESKDPWAGLGMLDGLADICMMVGQRDRALSILEHSVASPGGLSIEQLRISPFWEPLRGDPRFQKLLKSSPGQIPATATTSLGKSIAVLPFENLSEDKRSAYFASGVQDEIITRLAKIAGLKVISRNSTAHFQSKPDNLAEIARELGVGAVLEGSVQQSGSQVRVNVQLIEAQSSSSLWVESYDRESTDILRLEADIAAEVAAALRTTLTPDEKVRLQAASTNNPEAYALYLRGRRMLDTRFAPDNAAKAQQFFERAVLLDPHFALAHAAISEMHSGTCFDGDCTERHRMTARAEADEALRLQPNLGEAHEALGTYFYRVERNYEAAAKEYAIAQRASPNDAELQRGIAAMARRQGHWKAGIAGLERAVALDPRSMQCIDWLADTYADVGELAAAEERKKRALEVAEMTSPESLSAVRFSLGRIQWRRTGSFAGMEAAAASTAIDPQFQRPYGFDLAMYKRDWDAAARAVSNSPDSSFRSPAARAFLLGCAKLAKGDLAGARPLLEMELPVLEAQVAANPEAANYRAELGLRYAYLGRKTEAITEGRRAMELLPESRDSYEGPHNAGVLALIYARVGEPELALTLIEHLLVTPASGIDLNELRVGFDWDPLRSDPRFQKILTSPPPRVVYN